MKEITTLTILKGADIADGESVEVPVVVQLHGPDNANSLLCTLSGEGASLSVEAKYGHSASRMTSDWDAGVVAAAFGEGTQIQVANMPLCSHIVFKVANGSGVDATGITMTLQIQ